MKEYEKTKKHKEKVYGTTRLHKIDTEKQILL